jgi:hypothetical protein
MFVRGWAATSLIGDGVKMTARTPPAAALALTTLAFARRAPLRHAPTIYAFTNVAVLAMDAERLVTDQTVIVRDDRIEAARRD